MEQFLPVLDNFRLALNSNGTAEQLRTGVELIAKQMDEVLRVAERDAGGDGGPAVRSAGP